MFNGSFLFNGDITKIWVSEAYALLRTPIFLFWRKRVNTAIYLELSFFRKIDFARNEIY